MKNYYVYILASHQNGRPYVGVTSDLIGRVYQHKSGKIDGFTKKHNVHNLVYYEETESIDSALEREKHLKKWKREWKLNLIEGQNPNWEDLYINLFY
ncbi:MAG: GIY-YIG nuclease family protein [Patescibacteria group bacterium]|nr:GIY-YIG nuclease family protein [Patescibacteria group bacterium]MBU2509004.1 GIY-YIG nuclease family protein [Patescibacteria group bacterium]